MGLLSQPLSPYAKEFRLRGVKTSGYHTTYLVVVSPKIQTVRYHNGMKTTTDTGLKTLELQLPYQYWMHMYLPSHTGKITYSQSNLYFSPFNIHKRSYDKPYYRAWLSNLVMGMNVCWGYSNPYVDPTTGNNFQLNTEKGIARHMLFLYEEFFSGAFNSNAGDINTRKARNVSSMIEASDKVDVLDPNSIWYSEDAYRVGTQGELLKEFT